jgi:phage shock protein A
MLGVVRLAGGWTALPAGCASSVFARGRRAQIHVGFPGSRLTRRTVELSEGEIPGLVDRASLIAKAKASKLLDRAENPEETLDYSYEQQLVQLQNVKRGIADLATAKQRLQMQSASLQEQITKLDGQAREALQAGREDLAREALARKATLQGQLDPISQQSQQLDAQEQKLIDGEKALQAKVEAFRTQKEVIKAQYSAAEAQVKIGEAATGIGEHMADVGLAIQRAQDKTEQMQARAAAVDELTSSGALEDYTAQGDDIDRQLAQVQQGGQVDDELAKLKAELGQSDGPKKLGASS